MIIDQRTYTYHPSQFRPFLKAYCEEGFAITSKHLGKNLAILTTNSGIVNRTVQWFAYEDHDHRDRCRKGFLTDHKKQDFTKIADISIRQQESMILVPTSFSPIGGTNAETVVMDAGGQDLRVFEMITFKCIPGKKAQALNILEQDRDRITRKFAEYTIAYFTPETTLDDAIIGVWAYSSNQERLRRRLMMENDKEYREISTEFDALLQSRETVMLSPTLVSPLR